MSKDIVVPQKQAVATTHSGVAVGLAANITSSEMLLPRIELTQSKSPSVEDGKFRPGMLLNNLTQEELKSGVIVPVFAFKNVIRWKPRAQGGGIMYKTMDITPEVAADLQWNGDQKPLATAYLNVVCLVEGEDMPLIASFCNTSYTAGQKLVTMLQISGLAWKYTYTISSKKRTNQMGSYFVFDVARGKLATTDQQEAAAALYEQVKMMAIDTNYEGATDATVTEDESDGL